MLTDNEICDNISELLLNAIWKQLVTSFHNMEQKLPNIMKKVKKVVDKSEKI
ncbi:hypothetical protein K040078D81_50070 [Blautia hominis]|uniref:Uncharacterized protein n=1 Tax=Blautia hominis TaxID=2025493 RepID=A0ABQ0BHF5_9FIRM